MPCAIALKRSTASSGRRTSGRRTLRSRSPNSNGAHSPVTTWAGSARSWRPSLRRRGRLPPSRGPSGVLAGSRRSATTKQQVRIFVGQHFAALYDDLAEAAATRVDHACNELLAAYHERQVIERPRDHARRDGARAAARRRRAHEGPKRSRPQPAPCSWPVASKRPFFATTRASRSTTSLPPRPSWSR